MPLCAPWCRRLCVQSRNLPAAAAPISDGHLCIIRGNTAKLANTVTYFGELSTSIRHRLAAVGLLFRAPFVCLFVLVTLAASIGKRNARVRRLSVCLSVPS